MSFLDETGIRKLIELIKATFVKKADIPYEYDANGDIMMKEKGDE